MNSFFRELKQRRVYRVAIAYAIAAWLCVQIASTVLPAFQVPLWVLQMLIAGLALGFPIALVCAWLFDVSLSGVERTPEGTGEVRERNRRNGWLLAATGLAIAVMVIGGYWLWHPWRNGKAGAFVTAILEKSIAVLPLENLSEEKD